MAFPTFPLGSGLFQSNDELQNLFGGQYPFSMGSGMFGQSMPSVVTPPPVATMPALPSQKKGEASDRFMELMNNPMFQMGLNLLGSSHTTNPYGSALAGTLAMQSQLNASKLAAQNTQSEKELRAAQVKNLGSESDLHAIQAEIARRQQEMINSYLGQLHPNQTQGQMNPAGQGMPQGAQQSSILPPGVNPEAIQADLIFNQGKGIPAMIAKANEPVSGANGIMYRRGPNGSLQVDPTSMDAFRAMKGIEAGTTAKMDLVKVPMSDGTEVMMPRDQAASYLRTTPQEGAPQSPVQGNNFGNIRPVGSSTGFQSFTSPEAGLSAIDKNLSAYANKGIDTLSGVISRWAPPNENDTNALIAQASKRLGIDPNQKIDLHNPAVRQLVGSAIILQEQGNKVFSAQPTLGKTQPPSQTLEGQRVANDTAKTNQQLKEEQAKVAKAQATDTQNLQDTSASLDRMISGIDQLIKFDKNGKVVESHAGLPDVSGFTGMAGLYKATQNGRDAAAQIETLRSQLMVDTMNLLRGSSQTGSTGMGQLSQSEGDTLRGIISNLQIGSGQSLGRLQQQLKQVREFAIGAKQRMQNKYNTLYKEGSPNVAPSIGSTAGSGSAANGGNGQIEFLGFE